MADRLPLRSVVHRLCCRSGSSLDRRPATLLTLVVPLLVIAGGCSADAEPETAADWAEEVETRLVEESVERPVVDCVLSVARVELERNPLSNAATDELISNCERARAVIEGVDESQDAPDELAMSDQPFTLGDDPTLDALWAACEEGSGEACDQLFAAAPVGSDYEEFGVSCGNRPELLHCGELDAVPEAEAAG